MGAGEGVAPSNPEAIPFDQIQAELERIIVSGAFDASRRNRAFLRFIVEETLAGRGDRIKAYTIGTSVLQRDERSIRKQILSCESKLPGSGEASSAII